MRREDIISKVEKICEIYSLLYTSEKEYIEVIIPSGNSKKFYYVDEDYERCFKEIKEWMEKEKMDIILSNLMIIKKILTKK